MKDFTGAPDVIFTDLNFTDLNFTDINITDCGREITVNQIVII